MVVLATAQVKTSTTAHLRITLWAKLIVSTIKHLIKNWAQTCTRQTACPGKVKGFEQLGPEAQRAVKATLAPFFEVPRLKQVA